MSGSKVRMTVLAMVPDNDPYEAKQSATEIAADAGLTVLHVEEPDPIPDQVIHGSYERLSEYE